MSAPGHEAHVCVRTGFENYCKQAVKKMYSLVQEDPNRPVPDIYNSVRQKFVDKFEVKSRDAFLKEFPSYNDMQQQLYIERRVLTPVAPNRNPTKGFVAL